MMRVLGIPALVAALTFGLTTTLATPAAVAGTKAPAPEPAAAGPFKAQVIGVQWINPLVRRDYPTEWQLLWVQGLAKPNKNDEKVRDKPAKFTTVQPIAGVTFNLTGESTLEGYLADNLGAMFRPIGRPYVMNPSYFYSVQSDNPKDWRELHGIHVEFAVPVVDGITVNKATAMFQDAMDDEFEFRSVPRLSTANIPADVHTVAGGANIGFTSLAAAMDYLQANPHKSVWVMSWDAPDFPKDEQMSENCTLLILAGPTWDTGREPLAWIGRPSVQDAQAFETKEGHSRVAQAWQEAIRQASAQAAVAPEKIGHIIHDAGAGSDASGARMGMLGQAVTTTLPELDLLKDGFNTPKLLGDMRAGSALTNLALAIAWTHQKGAPVLVAGTTDPDHPTAVVVTPPAKPRLYDPKYDWFRARGEGTAYLPWWGMRRNVNLDDYMQGYSF